MEILTITGLVGSKGAMVIFKAVLSVPKGIGTDWSGATGSWSIEGRKSPTGRVASPPGKPKGAWVVVCKKHKTYLYQLCKRQEIAKNLSNVL